MTDQNRDARGAPAEPAKTRQQVDPMLRAGRVPWGWTLAFATGLVVIAVVLFAANSDDDTDMAETPAVETPVAPEAAPAPTPERSTTGSAPR
jgi:hypothetical protein